MKAGMESEDARGGLRADWQRTEGGEVWGGDEGQIKVEI